jgi:hypothetical protein
MSSGINWDTPYCSAVFPRLAEVSRALLHCMAINPTCNPEKYDFQYRLQASDMAKLTSPPT